MAGRARTTPAIRNPQVDALLDAIEVELDRDKRAALWPSCSGIYATDLPALPLFFRADAHVWPKWLEGVEPTGHMAPIDALGRALAGDGGRVTRNATIATGGGTATRS